MQVRQLVATAVADRRLRLLAAAVFLGVLAVRALQMVRGYRSDLLRPTDIGGDPSNYLSAGLRLLAGHPLYALTAGDRPVPSYDPPFFTVPLLSPPTIAVPWAVLGLLPPALAMTAWWLGCLAVVVLVVTVFALRAPWPLIAAAVPLTGGLVFLALAGNINALLFGAIALTWAVSNGHASRRAELAVGVLVGTIAALKLSPVLLVWWLLVVGSRRAGLVAVVSGAALALVTALLTGFTAFTDYLAIASETSAAGATSLSAAHFLAVIGLPASAVKALSTAVPLLAAIAVVVLRKRRRVSFVVAVAGVVWATPVVRIETIALLIAATIPWWDAPVHLAFVRVTDATKRVAWARSAVALAGVVAVAAVLTGALVVIRNPGRSSLSLTNESGRPVVVRLSRKGPTLGFPVDAGRSGVGWAPTAGLFAGRFVVYDAATCQPIVPSTKLPTSGGHLVVTAAGTTVVAASDATGPFLPYVDACGSPGK